MSESVMKKLLERPGRNLVSYIVREVGKQVFRRSAPYAAAKKVFTSEHPDCKTKKNEKGKNDLIHFDHNPTQAIIDNTLIEDLHNTPKSDILDSLKSAKTELDVVEIVFRRTFAKYDKIHGPIESAGEFVFASENYARKKQR